MAIKKWKAVKRQLSPEAEAATQSWVNDQLLAMSLREVEILVGKVQKQDAEDVGSTPSELPQITCQDGHRFLALRRYIESLGGELEVVARFGDTCIRLKGI